MRKALWLAVSAFVLGALVVPQVAFDQAAGTYPNHSLLTGRGPGVVGFGTITVGSSGQVLTFQTGADPIWTNPTGGGGGSGSITPSALLCPLFSTGLFTPPAYRCIIGSDLPNPSATTLGAVFSKVAANGSVLSGIDNSGIPTMAQTMSLTSNAGMVIAAGPNGGVNPTFQVDSSAVGGAQTGIAVTGQTSTNGVNLTVIGPLGGAVTGTPLIINAQGDGTVNFNTTGTGVVNSFRNLFINHNTTPTLTFGNTGNVAGTLTSQGSGGFNFLNSAGNTIARVNPLVATGITSYIQLESSNSTTAFIRAAGGPTDITLFNLSKGAGSVIFGGSSNQILVAMTPGATNLMTLTGGAVGNPIISTTGSNLTLTCATGCGTSTLPSTTGVLVNTGAISPTVSTLLDSFGTTQGSILYRNATNWTPLTPGTSGQVLVSQGAAQNPIYANTVGTGTVTSVTVCGAPITSSGSTTCTLEPQGRLTLVSDTPVMTTSQAAKTSIFYTSTNLGRLVPVYDGTNMIPRTICAVDTVGACELSIVMGANWAANSNYDVFIGLNAGTVTMCTGPAWTSDTGRGTGAGTTELEKINGLNTNKVSMTCRFNNTTTFTCGAHQCTYTGTFRTTSAGTTEYNFGTVTAGGGAGSLLVWNAHNRRQTASFSGDSTDNWTYAVANTWRSANASATMRTSFIRGLNEDTVDALYNIIGAPGSVTFMYNGIGVDSTTAFSGTTGISSLSTNALVIIATYGGFPGLGFHFVQAIEANSTTTASTWIGDAGTPTFYQSGMKTTLWN